MAVLAPPVVEPLLRRIREAHSAAAIEAAQLPREPSPEWRTRFVDDYRAAHPWLLDAPPPEAGEPPVPPAAGRNWPALRERWQSPVLNRLVGPLLGSVAAVLVAGLLVVAWPSSATSAVAPGDIVVPPTVESEVVRLDVVAPVAPALPAPFVRPAIAFEIGLSSVVPGERATFAVQSAQSMNCVAVVEHGGGTARLVLGEATGRGLQWTWWAPVTIPPSGGHVMLTCDGRATKIPFAVGAPPIGRLSLDPDSAVAVGSAGEQHP